MGLAARKIVPDSEKKIEEVSLSVDGKRLIFVFENGEGYVVPRTDLPGDDGTPITSIQIYDHRHAVALIQASGSAYDLPWDSIKHYAGGGVRRKSRLGERLKKVREGRGLSQEALSNAAGISRIQLSRLESGLVSPNLGTLLKLSGALKIAPRELLG